MMQVYEPAILDIAAGCLQRAIRNHAARILQSPDMLTVPQYRAVERLMRMAIALSGAGQKVPYVQVHGLPPDSPDDALPEILSVNITDLLAARASDHLPAALKGDMDALKAIIAEAERLLVTEDIQLV